MSTYGVNSLLASVRLLEAAGRLGSFSAAASELGMTQPGVSQQIAQTERALGVALFVRRHRGVTLTADGATLASAAADALARLEDALAAIRRTGRQANLVVRTDYGFAANWLIPRIGAFERLCPDVEIQILTAQAPSVATDPTIGCDVAIFFDAAPHAGTSRAMLFEEEVYPVCAPAYAERHGPFDGPDAFRSSRLLHLTGHESRWFTWDDWFAAMNPGTKPQERPRAFRAFSNFPMLLQSALQGEGIALGWRPLIDGPVASGTLVKAWPTPLRSRRGYVLNELNPANAACRQFCRWIVTASGASLTASAG